MSTSRGRVRTEPGHKRVRAYLQGHLVADTSQPLLVWESPYHPTYYFPAADVRADLKPTGATHKSPSRGDGQVHDVVVADAVASDAALTIPDSPIEEIKGHVRLEWDAMTSWFEEDEEVFFSPRSPYTRIDILPSSRHVKVTLGDEVLAESTGAHVLHETGLPPRWYLPRVDVRMDLLAPSETVTHCPYKGTASYLTTTVDGQPTDVAWTYPTPFPESERIAGLVAFDDGQVELLVDSEPAVA
jgi:uncharacterized protein (DUF427 family)